MSTLLIKRTTCALTLAPPTSDSECREPELANAHTAPIWELVLLACHASGEVRRETKLLAHLEAPRPDESVRAALAAYESTTLDGSVASVRAGSQRAKRTSVAGRRFQPMEGVKTAVTQVTRAARVRARRSVERVDEANSESMHNAGQGGRKVFLMESV